MTVVDAQGVVPVSGPAAMGLLEGSVRLSGVQALVRVLIDQGRADLARGRHTAGFVSGYPGSPVGGLHGELERHAETLTALDVLHSPALNEELAATAIWGAQTAAAADDALFDGVFALWYGKAPGVDRAGDALRHGAMRGVAPEGGVLVVAGDDPHANATMFPTDSAPVMQAWGMPVLYPGSAQDVLDLGLHGYALSRASGLWVGFKLVTPVADGTGTALVGPGRVSPRLPRVEVDGVPFEPVLRVSEAGPGLRPAERDLREGRAKLAAGYIRDNRLNPVTVDPTNGVVGLVAPGKTYYDVRQALTDLGLDDDELARRGVRVKKVAALCPVDPQEWRDFAHGLRHVVVVEEKGAFLETAIKDALYDRSDRPVVVGKRDVDGTVLLDAHDELTVDRITEVLAAQLRRHVGELPRAEVAAPAPRALLPLLTDNPRAGFFCSGCPHNTSLVAPEGAIVGAGIGCHTMTLLVPRPEHRDVSGFTQMGGEGAQWIGQSPFVGHDHVFQNLGDGTFHHSGSLAVRAAIASGVNVTYKLLYNSVVGMTGGQDVRGQMAVPELATALLAEGVAAVMVTTADPRSYRRQALPRGVEVWHRDRIVEAQERLAEIPGVTVLVHDQHCAAERRRLIGRGEIAKPAQRVFVHQRVCEGCGDCNAKSACLSVQPVETELGRRTTIHQSSCNVDFSCLKGDCPSFLTVTSRTGFATETEGGAVDPPTSPAEPVPLDVETYAIHMTGIGGTGVLSITQLLSAAAALDGFASRSLDLTGSAIKAGPVTSQLHLFKSGVEPSAAIGAGQADLFLGFDLLAAMRPEALAPLGSDRTVVVASSSEVPTARMALDPSTPYPTATMLRETVDALSRRRDNVYVDAEALAMSVCGDHMAANALLVGIAFQVGALPMRSASIERAIQDQGVSVELSLRAFRWGRAVAARPDLADRHGPRSRPTGAGLLSDTARDRIDALAPGPGLRADLEVRVPDLLGYQGTAYADRYLGLVAEAMEQERDRGIDDEGLARAVARSHHRLLAYKDEYEVARLLLMEAPGLAAELGPDAKVSWNLHPPLLRSWGMTRKIRLGAWFRPAFVVLRAMRHVRGHWYDPFGRARVRRLERALVVHHETLMRRAWALPVGVPAGDLVALAQTAELVRGYEGVKIASVEGYLVRVEQLASSLGVEPPVLGWTPA